MAIHELAGKPVPKEMIIDLKKLIKDYYEIKPDVNIEEQKVSFGTSGHRGTSSNGSFNENHIKSVVQAVCEIRKKNNINGPLFLGMDTHALSEPAHETALKVLIANKVEVKYHKNLEFTPTPVISHAILTHNSKNENKADGLIITPSHNPPTDGGIKYNPPSGGPAEKEITDLIEKRANEILKNNLTGIKEISLEEAIKKADGIDLILPYVKDLKNIIDVEAISNSKIKIGVDPLGGSGINYWKPIADYYNLNLEIVNDKVDKTFSFMTVDKDGKIRMDCSSPYAMKNLIKLKTDYDIAFGNDPDFDRHGIVTKSVGLMNPNHYLAVAINYLFRNRKEWNPNLKVGKTLVSSSMIDRVADSIDKEVSEVPVGFKWFVDGLLNSKYGFGGEESAGATFLRKNGKVWTTDKDGIIMNLLAAEILATTKKDPGEHYLEFEKEFGSPKYKRVSGEASLKDKEKLKNLKPEDIKSEKMAGEKILLKLTNAPGNNASIGGLKVVTKNGWFAARPSGTEKIYKIYGESFLSQEHLEEILDDAKSIVKSALT